MNIQVLVIILFVAFLSHQCIWALGYLDYSRRQLSEVPSLPGNASIIYTLKLAYNNIMLLDHTSFVGYYDLKILKLNHNSLRLVMNGSFNHMHQLEYLSMMENKIVQFPSAFGPSDQTLQYFNLWRAVSDNSLLAYPYFSGFVQLETLLLGGNHNLQPLDATILPPTLTNIVLNYGAVSNFPHFSPDISRLEKIGIQNNKIEIIPQSAIALLSELLKFHAARNRIIIFPNFVNCSFLEELFIDHNLITVVPRGNIEGLTRLRILWLQNNRLSHMTNISHLTSLREFNISYNIVAELPQEILRGLPNLLKLSCEHNQISVLPDVVALLPSLQEFYVQGNRLLTLPDYYAHSSPLTFHVRGNPLICNRSLCWMRLLNWTNPTSPLSLDTPTCTEPPPVANFLVAQAHPMAMMCYDGNCVHRIEIETK